MTAIHRPPQIPGSRLRALTVALFDRATADRILFPAIADLQHEVADARALPLAARLFVHCRCHLAFWRTFAVCLAARPGANQGTVWGQMIVGAGAVLVALTAGLLYGPLTRSGATDLGRLAFLLVPQALAVSIPCSVLGAGLLGRGREGRPPAITPPSHAESGRIRSSRWC